MLLGLRKHLLPCISGLHVYVDKGDLEALVKVLGQSAERYKGKHEVGTSVEYESVHDTPVHCSCC